MSSTNLLFGILFLLLATAIFFIVRLEIRLKRIFRGRKAQDLETLIASVVEGVDMLNKRADTHADTLTTLDKRLEKHGRGVKLIRFNPFTDVGGNQSFAVAIINKEGDGVVFSSLYSRERMSVFAKPVREGRSDIELTPEEQSVIEDARKSASL